MSLGKKRDQASLVEILAIHYRTEMRRLRISEPMVVEIVQSKTGERMIWLRGRPGLMRAVEWREHRSSTQRARLKVSDPSIGDGV
ncbi:hypothetical protein LTR95_003776 [Oleoguttula sp. CCFEE 5521]